MSRLVVNPDAPDAWEIQLKPGMNRLGRSPDNDFQINDPSVSSSHCHILVNDGVVTITDLNSTNGTFVNFSQIQQATLNAGQPIRLGSVELRYFADAVIRTAPAPAMRPKIWRVSEHSGAVAEPASAPPVLGDGVAVEEVSSGPRFCKFHPKSPARYVCHQCNRTFCEFCVTTRAIGGEAKKMCRSCGVECEPLHFEFAEAHEAGFFAKLPGAFIYPFKGAGIIILIFAAVLFPALAFAAQGGLFGLFIRVAFYGILFLFMQNILHTTAANEKESLDFPDLSSLGGAAGQLTGTVLASFWLAIGLAIAKVCDVPVPVEAIIAAFVLGGIYFPMAFLAVAMKDSVLAANPLVVIPAIMKKPLQYGITVVLLLGVFGFKKLGDILSEGAGSLSLSTTHMNVFFMAVGFKIVWAFISVYLLTVTIRILGLFYNSTKTYLGWFSY